MKYQERKKAVLLLEDGTSYEGYAIGKVGSTTGEICFNTGMAGYQETFTDPSYYGQILCMTTAHIGNYGAMSHEVESSSVKIKGLVCKNFSQLHSRYGDSESLQDYLERNELVGISDIDTRSLVRHIRHKGAMNAIISSDFESMDELKEALKNVPSMEGLELASVVSTKDVYDKGDVNSHVRVAVLDLGIKENILRCLEERGCHIRVFPHNANKEDILAFEPSGIFLSNGPGDPAVMQDQIDLTKELIRMDIPMFGICLGHQIICLASGLTTYKMHNGHRGVNHPIKNLETGKCEVTSQNHGFVVNKEDVDKVANIEMTHVHLNDDTLAGIRYTNKDIFSVQFHPEASPGPHDSRYLFDNFVNSMKKQIA